MQEKYRESSYFLVPVHLAEDIEYERLYVEVERLVVEEELGKQTEVLAVELEVPAVHLVYREAGLPVDLTARGVAHAAIRLVGD